MFTTPANLRTLADAMGALGSVACAVHCLVVPVLLVGSTALPLGLLGDERFHLVMLWIVFPAGIVAFSLGCWRHRDRWVLVAGALGLILILAAGTILHDVVGEAGERVVTVFAAALLIAAHLRNFRLCRGSADESRCDHP